MFGDSVDFVVFNFVDFAAEVGVVDDARGGGRFGAGEEGDEIDGTLGVEEREDVFTFSGTARPCVFIDTGGGDFSRVMLAIDS